METTQAGEKLRKLRGSRTQEEVASAVGISRTALCQYENGTRVPRDAVKIKLAEYYKRSVNYIFYT